MGVMVGCPHIFGKIVHFTLFIFLMLVWPQQEIYLYMLSPPHLCAEQPAAGQRVRAEHPLSAERDVAEAHRSDSNVARPAHTAMTRCRSQPH